MIAFSRGYECPRWYYLVIFVKHPHQYFVVNGSTLTITDWNNRLIVQFKTIVFKRLLNTYHPVGLSLAMSNFNIIGVKYLYTITSCLLGCIACTIGRLENLIQLGTFGINFHQANANPYLK